MTKRIAYVIPKYPGQTHIFFWREMKALEKLGVVVDAVSTQPPPSREVVHEWAAEALRTTPYLFPLSFRDVVKATGTILSAGPGAWIRCLGAIVSADGSGIRGRVGLAGMVLIAAKLLGLQKAAGWTHLHAHSAANAASICMFVRLLGGIPYSLTLHGPLEMYGPGQNVKWGFASFGIAVTERLRSEILREVRGIDAGKVEVAAMGVDLERFVRVLPYAAPAIGTRSVIVTCGRLHPGKGHQELIRAVDLLIKRGHDVELQLLGEGPARPMLEGLISDLGLAGRATLRGAVSESGVRDSLEKAQVFALGSHDEAIGVATMEAMAMGLPVVVTRVGGVPELVRDGLDGLLVPPKEPVAMADAIERVLGDPAAASRMGASGEQRVREKFGSGVSAAVIARRAAAVQA